MSAGDITNDPVLQYALMIVEGKVYGTTSNWGSIPYAEPKTIREEWFAKFIRLLILEIPGRLETEYSTKKGGCIDGPLEMAVVRTGK